MNTVMGWADFWDRRVKQFTIWDLKLAQVWTAGWVLLIVKLFPQIMQLSAWWFVGTIALCAPRLLHVMFVKKEAQS